MKRILDAYLLAKPATRGWIEWGLLCLTGIVGLAVSSARLPGRPYTNGLGGMLVLGGLLFHAFSERTHREAHRRSAEITGIVDRGMYGRIRHPLYLSLIVINLGLALAFGVPWALVPAVLFSFLSVLTALREEQFLLGRFPEQYGRYRERVRWRMIPGLF